MHYVCVCACWWTRAVCVHGVGAQHICVQCGSVYVCTMRVCAPVGGHVLFVCTV